MTTEKLRFFAYLGITIISAGVIFITLGKYIIPAVLPFAIAWAVAAAVRRPSAFLAGKIRISERVLRPVLALFISLGIIFAIGWGAFALLSEAWRFLTASAQDGAFSEVSERISAFLGNIASRLGLDGALKEELMRSLTGVLSDAVAAVASRLTYVASSVPHGVLFVAVTAVSVVYFAIDLDRINAAVYRLLPAALATRLSSFKEHTLSVAVRYLRSYSLIMLLTFAVVFFGLSLLGIEYALLTAFIISVLDVLPIIGVGVILVPYGALMLLYGNTFEGVGLLVLALVCYVVRQVAEPRILGKNLGIHPLLTLVLMYAGYSVAGIVGLVLLPAVGVLFSGNVSESQSTAPPTS